MTRYVKALTTFSLNNRYSTFLSIAGSSPTVYSDVGTKQEGESCGSCFSPSSNYDCGKCISGLECVPDENAHLLPDLPSRCRVPQSKVSFQLNC